MPLRTNTRLLRAVREVLAGNAQNALPYHHQPKPHFPHNEKKPVALPRSSPEAQGLSSEYIADFFTRFTTLPGTNPHALMVMRNGHVVAETYYSPYKKDIWHVTHSLCKSFTGAAVGLAISEGLFRLDDPVLYFFPQSAPLIAPKGCKDITVRHLLTMSSGIRFNEVGEVVEQDWIRAAFAEEPAFAPGSSFSYNSMNSYILSALVCKTSGQSLVEYLTPRLFAPMGFGPVGWEKSSAGYEKGGWGMYITLEDMAKFGQLHLQKGRWMVDGKMEQLLPPGWVRWATQPQIAETHGQEYGYHIWADSKNGLFMMNGMFGQTVIAFPKQNILVATVGADPCTTPLTQARSLIIEHFAQCAPSQEPLPDNPKAQAALAETLKAVCCPPTAPAHLHSGFPLAQFCGTTWRFEPSHTTILPVIIQFMDNNFCKEIKALRLEKSGENLIMLWEAGEETHCIPVGLTSSLPSTLCVGPERFEIATQAQLRYNEDDEPVLKISLSFLEHSSSRIIKLSFKNENLLLRLDEIPSLEGALLSAQAQNNSTLGEGNNTPLNRMLKNNKYLNYRIEQLCTPSILGARFP